METDFIDDSNLESFDVPALQPPQTIMVVRKKGRRSTSIKLQPYKPVQVWTNASTPIKDLQKFVEEKLSWIQKHLKKFEEKVGPRIEMSLEPGKLLPLFGVWRELKPYPSFQNKIYFEAHSTEIRVYLPKNMNLEKDAEKIKRKLLDFYKEQALDKLPSRLYKWAYDLDLHPTALSFSRSRGRWGSCTSKGVVTLNWKLICLPDILIDYVIVHELCHLKYLNHSKNFWDMLEKILPDRKVREERLNELQFVTDFLNH